MPRLFSLIVVLNVVGFLGSQTGEPFKPGKLPKTEQASLVPGLTVRFFDPVSGHQLDVRRSRLAAIHVPEGMPASPFQRPGPFNARFDGYVKTPLRSDYRFQIVAKGAAELRVNGKVVLRAADETKESDIVELARGFNKIEIAYSSPAKGDAMLRVSWVSDGFNMEPLPPEALFSRGDDADLVARSQVRDGRLTFATHSCHRCHALPDGVAANKDAMPELQQQAPSLDGAGSRFGQKWLAKWILNPRDFRPQSTMPALLHGEAAPQDAADIAAYLGTLKADIAAPAEGEIEKGEKLFRTLGCMACHHFGDPKEEDPFDRLPLTFIHEKLQPAALFNFLTEPHRHYAWSRMPDFKLTPMEADHLAAFVTDQAKGKLDDPPAGDAKRGEELLAKVGCANCHVLKTGTALIAKNILPFPKNTAAGCLADDAAARKNAPDFGFAKERLVGNREFLKSHGDTLARETAAEFSLRQVAAMKCTACHRRDGGNSRWFQVMEEEGTLPEFLPLLTWAGEKLQPAWTQKLLSGGIDHRARPWLKARMPAFPARADLISLGLTHEHGFGQKESDRPAPDAELAEVGKKLLPQMGGLNCVQCHGIGKTPPIAPFEAPGINLLDAAHRLRYSYYQRWMLDPPRLDPTTKMVKLAPDGKTTGIREIFDGDARKQFDALWQYIQTLPTKDEK